MLQDEISIEADDENVRAGNQLHSSVYLEILPWMLHFIAVWFSLSVPSLLKTQWSIYGHFSITIL